MSKPKWKKIALRSYELRHDLAQAFVFGAHRPDHLWALSVYWSGGNYSRVDSSFVKAKRRAEQTIAAVEMQAEKKA